MMKTAGCFVDDYFKLMYNIDIMRWIVIVALILTGSLILFGFEGRAIQSVNYWYFIVLAGVLWRLTYETKK